eukprot:gene20286-6782_t
MLKVLMIVLAASATNAAPCSVDDYGESLTAVTTCTSKLATDYAKVVLNFTANCESTSTIFTAWTSCVMANSKCVNGAFRSAVSTAVSLYSTILPTCDLVDRPYYTADFVLNPIP